MTTYPGFSTDITDAKVLLAKLSEVTVSGVVSNGVGPVAREVCVYKYPLLSVAHRTVSSRVDGTWSITLNCGPGDRLVVKALGEAGENAQIYDFVGI